MIARASISSLRAQHGGVAVWALPIGFFLVFCLLWQALINLGSIPSAFLPRPTDIFGYIALHLGTLADQAFITGQEAMLSLMLATALGLSVGSVIFASTLIRETLYPVLVTLQVLPKVAMAPLFVVWLGTGNSMRIAFGAFMCFFPVLLATIAGLEQTDGNAVRLCRSLKATPFQIFWAARVPFALPHIFAGLKIAATLAVTGVVIGEFMTADSGLGFLIINASSRFDGKSMFAAILMLCVTGLVLFFVVVAAQQGCKKWYYGR